MVQWASALAGDLSQGDLVSDIWVGSQAAPRTALTRGPTAKGGASVWHGGPAWRPEADGRGYFLAQGRSAYALVLSQSCEIDKRGGKGPVLVAPVLPLEETIADAANREVIRSGRRFAFFPLPSLAPHFPESYVDLRAISYLSRKALDSATRVLSSTEAGTQTLATHLVAFFTRIDVNALLA